MSTTRPAAVLGRAGELGTLSVGSIADVAILERREGRFTFTDSYRQEQIGNELLVAAATIRGGELLPGGARLPNEPP
jgi:dihydroorotase